MKNKKLCPISFCRHGPLEYCLKERCAWYDNYECECILFTIMLRLCDIDNAIRMLKNEVKELKKEE